MITFPRTLDEATAAVGEKRAGGTDVQQRYRAGVSTGPLVDICHLSALRNIERDEDGGLRIGTLVQLASLLSNRQFTRDYAGLASAIASIATPQVRAVGTVGGNLLQHPRCAYYHHPEVDCYRKGGTCCPARLGRHLSCVCFDSQPCIAPYPSTLGMALLAYDASFQFYGQPFQHFLEVVFQERFTHSHNANEASPLLVQIALPPPRARERAAYRRVTGRAQADWPLVEVLVRLEIQKTIEFARIAVGGVAPTPLRLQHVEALLMGQPATVEVFQKAVDVVGTQANPLPFTGYKVDLLQACVFDTLLSLRDLSDQV